MDNWRWMRAGLLLLVASCATSPTGRTQLILVSDAEMATMGATAFAEMQKKGQIVEDSVVTGYVRCVADAVAAASVDVGRAPERWTVQVFKDDTANAFALPGGKIGVHTGMLTVAKTQAQLAAVLAHEVGHVVARHGSERVSQGLAAETGLSVAELATPTSITSRNLLMGALGLGVQVGILMPYGRAQESEADAIGLDIMARAGFAPEEAVQLWKNMSAAGGSRLPQFLSTHPSHETRIADLQAKMPSALRTFHAAQSAGKNPSCLMPRMIAGK